MSSDASLYGLTHQCDDPTCHVPGFVATLRTMEHPPGDDCRLLDCPRCVTGALRILDDLATCVIPPAEPATPDAGDASEGLSEAEREALAAGWPDFWKVHAAAQRIIAVHVSAAATKARAEERAAVDAVLVCPHNPSGRHYYALDATCTRCEMPSWVEAAVRVARLAPDTAGGDR